MNSLEMTEPTPHVYLFRSGDTCRYKIGRTKHCAAKRRRALRTGNPDPLCLIKEWPVPENAHGFERLLHATFQPQRLIESDATEFFEFENIDAIVRRIDELHQEFTTQPPSMPDVEQTSDELVPLSDALLSTIRKRQNLSAQIYLLQQQRDALDVDIKRSIGASAGIQGTHRALATWRTTSSHRIDTQSLVRDHPEMAFKYRVPVVSRRLWIG